MAYFCELFTPKEQYFPNRWLGKIIFFLTECQHHAYFSDRGRFLDTANKQTHQSSRQNGRSEQSQHRQQWLTSSSSVSLGTEHCLSLSDNILQGIADQLG